VKKTDQVVKNQNNKKSVGNIHVSIILFVHSFFINNSRQQLNIVDNKTEDKKKHWFDV